MKRTKSMIYKPSVEARDLLLYAINTNRLYDAMIVPVVKNLARKYSKGIYDATKAVDAFFSIATEAAKMYAKEFAQESEWPVIFDVTTRYTTAADMVDYYFENIEKGDL